MRRIVGTILGKSVAQAVKLRGKTGGQAMPGWVVQTVVPGYLEKMLKQLPEGVVMITGTNGKTTTTKMVVELLQANGKRVLTNPTGSNLTRGIISSVSQQAHKTGKLPFDIAVFELDEAYARLLTATIAPRWVLALNASRDQLDRFGEVDMVVQLIGATMLTATEGIVVNADDKRLSKVAEAAKTRVDYFAVASHLLKLFPRDDELVAVASAAKQPEPARRAVASVELKDLSDQTAIYHVGGEDYTVRLQVTGQHNFQNAAAAVALVRALIPDVAAEKIFEQLSTIQPAFGRGQLYTLKDGSHLQLNLVKNPASFRQGLASYISPDTTFAVAINDAPADSRDMSWLWDIDFTDLQGKTVVLTSGVRAADMALRLQYDNIAVGGVEPDLEKALTQFAQLPGEKVLFASYTAMMKLHSLLERKAGKEL